MVRALRLLQHFFRQAAWLSAALATLVLPGCSDEDCSITVNPDRTRTMTCPDGGQVTLPPWEEDQPTGNIRGTARLFGLEDHSAIRIALKNAPVETTAAADGSFTLPELPAGWYGVDFAATGWEDQSQKSVMVLPGDQRLPDVELKIGRKILDGGGFTLLPAPDSETFLAWQPNGRLTWVEPESLRTRTLGETVRNPVWTADGRKVLYLLDANDGSFRSALTIFEPATGAVTRVATDVFSFQPTPDGDSVVYQRGVERNPVEIWHHPTRHRTTASLDAISWALGPDGRILLLLTSGASQALVVWDLAAEGGTALAGADWVLPSFAPDNRSFFFRMQWGEAFLWDGNASEVVPLGDDVASWAFSADGNRLLERMGDGTLYHWDLPTRSRLEVAGNVVRAIYAPDGDRIAFVRTTDSGSHELLIWNRTTRATTVVAGFPEVTGLAFSPDGSELFVLNTNGDLRALSVWKPGGTVVALSASSFRLPRFSPDGSGAVFADGNELFYRSAAGAITPLGRGTFVLDFPVEWSHDGSLLRSVLPGGVGTLSVFEPSTGTSWKVAGRVRETTVEFDPDGGLRFLAEYDAGLGRGLLARWHKGGALEPIRSAARTPLALTPDGSRLLFPSDSYPVRGFGVAALWDRALDRTIPVDTDVSSAAIGRGWLAWSTARIDGSGDGVFLSHHPRDLPLVEDELPVEAAEVR